MKLIELTGLPGTGKSYTAQKLTEAIPRTVYPQSDLTSLSRRKRVGIKLVMVALYVLRSPSISWALIQAFRFRLHPQPLFNFLFVFSVISRSRAGYSLLLDQGLVQAIWSCQFRGIRLDDVYLGKVLACVFRQSGIKHLVVIHVTADSKQHLYWLNRRRDGQSPVEGASQTSLASLAGSDERALSLLTDLRASHPEELPLTVLRYENRSGADISELVATIQHQVSRSADID